MFPDEDERSPPFGRIDREKDLVMSTFMHLTEVANIANLDLEHVALFMLFEALAHLQFHSGVEAEDALRRVRNVLATRVEEVTFDNTPEDEDGEEDEALPAAPPASIFH